MTYPKKYFRHFSMVLVAGVYIAHVQAASSESSEANVHAYPVEFEEPAPLTPRSKACFDLVTYELLATKNHRESEYVRLNALFDDVHPQHIGSDTLSCTVHSLEQAQRKAQYYRRKYGAWRMSDEANHWCKFFSTAERWLGFLAIRAQHGCYKQGASVGVKALTYRDFKSLKEKDRARYLQSVSLKDQVRMALEQSRRQNGDDAWLSTWIAAAVKAQYPSGPEVSKALDGVAEELDRDAMRLEEFVGGHTSPWHCSRSMLARVRADVVADKAVRSRWFAQIKQCSQIKKGSEDVTA